ncbi:hypothetical protein NMG60_11013775 [Bertholletia excelsa]
MGESRASFRFSGGDQRAEIVSGKSFNNMRAVSSPRTSRPSGPTRKPWRIWRFNDQAMKRRRRIAKYKVYAVDGRVKESIKKGIRWIKSKCSEIVHGS